MQGCKSVEAQIFYQISLEQLVPQDHLVRRLNKAVEFDWVRTATAQYYSHTGKPSIDPVVIAKMLVLGFLYNIGSERQLMREIQVNLAYRWYLGYDLDEQIPNHSVLSKARRRLGTEFFEQIFSYALELCRQAGLVEGSNLLMDSTSVSANASLSSVTEIRWTPQQYWSQLESNVAETADNPLGSERPREQRLSDNKRSLTDPDATLFNKGGKSILGYKAHIGVDSANGIITAATVTTGSADDTSAVPEIIERHTENIDKPKAVAADGQYGSQQCLKYLQENGIETVIKHRGGGNKHGKFDKELFTYDERKDLYVCPAGNILKRFRTDKTKNKAYYRCDKKLCGCCEYRRKCIGANAAFRVVTRYDTPYAERAKESCLSRRGQKLLKLRQSCVEGLFGQGKSLHGLARARWRGLSNVLMQVLVTAAVLNIKKLLNSIVHTARRAVLSVENACLKFCYCFKLFLVLFLGLFTKNNEWNEATIV
jgi:transposase